MKVTLAPAAQGDLDEIKGFIARDNPARAASFVAELLDCCIGIGRMPRAFPSANVERDRSIRRRKHGAYIVYYRLRDERVQVLRIVHGSRDQGRLFEAGGFRWQV